MEAEGDGTTGHRFGVSSCRVIMGPVFGHGDQLEKKYSLAAAAMTAMPASYAASAKRDSQRLPVEWEQY
uniref:Uncharacterized protein n=1 Tax=Leersia perrieri TaxID=77586 RepID=A0A0D9X993_9ORYZ